MRPAPDQHPLLRDLRPWQFAGGVLVVGVLAGIACGLLAIAVDPAALTGSQAWLLIPASIPVAYCLARGRSLLAGALGGFFAALTAFVTTGLYLIWQVACFVITFMGEC